MKLKLNTVTLPFINPDKRFHHNFYSVCIKAIEDNKEGVLDKKECINKIIKLRDQNLRLNRKKLFDKTSSINFSPSRTGLKLKIKTSQIINKRRNLSQILSEAEKLEAEILKKQTSSKIIDIEDKNQSPIKIRKSKVQKDIISNTYDYQRAKKKATNINKKKTTIKNKDKINQNLSKRYSTFKKINEYLESNNVPIFELLQHDPFQKKPYQISQGYEFLEAVKFKNYEFVKEALQTSNDYLFVFDYYGQTCYHWAAKLGNIKMLRILLDYGKHHNQKDFKGRTPLYLAAVNNNREICDLLLRYKANIHLKDNYGNSASDVAGSKELKYYLGDLMTQPYSNPNYKKKVADFLRKREFNIQQAEIMKSFKKKEEKDKNENDEEKEEQDK